MSTYTRADIAKELVKALYIDQKLAADAVENVLIAMRNALIRGQNIELRHFGTFRVLDRKQRLGRNPKTGVPAVIPASMRVRFRVSALIEREFNVDHNIQNAVQKRIKPAPRDPGVELVNDEVLDAEGKIWGSDVLPDLTTNDNGNTGSSLPDNSLE